MTLTTTIAAIATPPGAGERGVIRLSGPRARELVAATFVPSGEQEMPARRGLARGRFRDGVGEQPALCLWMSGPHSFTREDVAELHLPGSPPLLAAALARLCALGAEPAQPGEFTRRAFLSGRIDLTRAEGVLALVCARNEAERRASTALLFGGLADRVDALRTRLADLRALCEASLDFDASDTGHVDSEELAAMARAIADELARAGHWEARRGRASDGARIVLAGLPNAGKSALFNALAGEERALVSALPGTTRDVLAVEIELCGIACRLIDTAGVDASTPRLERDAQELGRGQRDTADLVVWVVDAGAPGDPREVCALLAGTSGRILAWNKIDVPGVRSDPPRAWLEACAPPAEELVAVAVSGLRALGLDRLRAAITRLLEGASGGAGAGVGRELSARHRLAFENAARELTLGLDGLAHGASLELFVEHLRAATDALDAITGATTPEEILDRIFARFCIGK